jgi:type I restriction enzyme S subunit
MMSSKRLATNNNQLPEGYKKTEFGVIPEDWEVCYIQDLVEKGILEKPLDGNHGNIHPKSKDFVPFGIPFIMSNNVQNGLIDTENCHFIRKEQADKLQKGFSFVGDVLLTHKGTVGNVAIVSNIPTEYIMLTPQVTYYRVRDHNRLQNNFIKIYFESTQFQTKLEHLSEGGTRAYIGITNQRKLPFLLPPLPEQKTIAQTLSDVDALIAALDKLIAKKRHIKTATMQQLLTGKTRLPGLGEGKDYKKSAIGVIPEDWEVVNYGEHLNILSGLGFNKSEYTNYGVKLLRIDNISYGTIAWDSIAFLPEGYIDKYNHLVIQENDILLALNRPITNGRLKFAMAKKADGLSILYQRVGKIIFTSQAYDKKYAFHLLFKFIKQFVEESAVGTDQPFISTTNLKKYKLPLPPKLEEQKAIAQVLSDIDTEIAALEKRRAKTQAIKQGMMQELLTGRTRLKIEHPDEPITKNSQG